MQKMFVRVDEGIEDHNMPLFITVQVLHTTFFHITINNTAIFKMDTLYIWITRKIFLFERIYGYICKNIYMYNICPLSIQCKFCIQHFSILLQITAIFKIDTLYMWITHKILLFEQIYIYVGNILSLKL